MKMKPFNRLKGVWRKRFACSLVLITTVVISGYAAANFFQKRDESRYVSGLYVGFKNFNTIPNYAYLYLEGFQVTEEDVSCYSYPELIALNASCGVEFTLPKSFHSTELMRLSVNAEYSFWGEELDRLTVSEQCALEYSLVVQWGEGFPFGMPVCTSPTTWSPATGTSFTAIMIVNGS